MSEPEAASQIFDKVQFLSQCQTDMWMHMFTLAGYARHPDVLHITEMGVREVVSTWSFLYGMPDKLVCYDLYKSGNIDEALTLAKGAGIDMEFHEQNTVQPGFEIEETDLLFIDTLHTYDQLKQELFMHGNKSRKYIIFHDTDTFGWSNEPPFDQSGTQGLRPAIIEFTDAFPHWELRAHYPFCNGLTVLERV